jgi:tRNA U38,U39,U40 pseudouridine synthase TruA
MVGTAMLVGSGLLPEKLVDLALKSPFFYILPMAPANGLFLASNGFAKLAHDKVRQIDWVLVKAWFYFRRLIRVEYVHGAIPEQPS